MKTLDHKKYVESYLDGVWAEAKSERDVFLGKLRSSRRICLFGAGEVGQAVAYDLVAAGIRIDFFCDNNKALWGKTVHQGIKCISVHELEAYKTEVLVLVTTGYFKEVCEN